MKACAGSIWERTSACSSLRGADHSRQPSDMKPPSSSGSPSTSR